jgi:site-specific recombinase XerD
MSDLPHPSRPSDAPDVPIAEAINLFITRNRPNWKGQTERTYRKSMATFEEFAEAYDLDTTDDFELWRLGQYTDFLLAKDYASVTVQSKQKQVRRWLKWLESQGYVDVGTHLAIEPLKLGDSEQTSDDILRSETFRELLSNYRQSKRHRATRRHALLELIGHTGARRSCIRGLDVDDYDPESRTLKR